MASGRQKTEFFISALYLQGLPSRAALFLSTKNRLERSTGTRGDKLFSLMYGDEDEQNNSCNQD
jgi:hypothetical protein